MKMLRTIFFPALVFMMMLSTAVQTRLNLDASAGIVNVAAEHRPKNKNGLWYFKAHGGTPVRESCEILFAIKLPFNL